MCEKSKQDLTINKSFFKTLVKREHKSRKKSAMLYIGITRDINKKNLSKKSSVYIQAILCKISVFYKGNIL